MGFAGRDGYFAPGLVIGLALLIASFFAPPAQANTTVTIGQFYGFPFTSIKGDDAANFITMKRSGTLWEIYDLNQAQTGSFVQASSDAYTAARCARFTSGTGSTAKIGLLCQPNVGINANLGRGNDLISFERRDVTPPRAPIKIDAPATVHGEDGNDVLGGTDQGDAIDGGPGVDSIQGYGKDDDLWGGSGIDTIIGGPGPDWIRANDDSDPDTVDCGGPSQPADSYVLPSANPDSIDRVNATAADAEPGRLSPTCESVTTPRPAAVPLRPITQGDF